MILNLLLAFGIVMSSSTQLIVPHASSTFGEVALLSWIMLSLAELLTAKQIALTPALIRLIGFWLGLAILTCVGLIVGFSTKVLYMSYVLHDSLAYVLLALITCLLAAKQDAKLQLRQIAWFAIGIANFTFVIQFSMAAGLFHFSNINPWYWDRFRGWSQNPNQLALYCAIYGPIALHLATTSRTQLAKIAGLTGLILPVTAGFMTKSDTYVLTVILTGGLFMGLRFHRWFATAGAQAVGLQIAMLILSGAVVLTVALVPLGVIKSDGFLSSVTRDRGGLGLEETTERRRELWSEAIQNGLESGSLGLGPGPHQEVRPLNEPLFQVTPFEAHNTFLDMFTQGGLLAVCLLVWIIGSAGMFAWRANLDALVGLAITVTFFAVPHLIIRHPIVWFAITLCLITGSARVQPVQSHRLALMV
jgi:hypothetical protein